VHELVRFFKKSDPKLLMKGSDYEKYRNLPDVVVIYRGTQDKRAKVRGLSWTLDKEKAKWFSRRFGEQGGKVYQAKIEKKDVFMFTNEKGESEVTVNPMKLKDIEEINTLGVKS
jgi:hypothetical protein